MKLIEYDGPDPGQGHVVDESPEHDAGGLDDEPCVAANLGVEPHLIAHLTAERHAAELGDAVGDGSGRKPAGLEEYDPVGLRQIIKHCRGHERRFARPRGRGDDDRASAGGSHDLRERGCHRQVEVWLERGGCGRLGHDRIIR